MNDENDDNKELLRCLRTDVEEVEKDMDLKRKKKVPAVLKTFSLSLCAAVLVVVALILTFSFVEIGIYQLFFCIFVSSHSQ